jgi:formamidopyrimidine-DNA glycosylase
MPELPEVETIVRQLEPKLKGQAVEKVEIIDFRVLKNKNPVDFKNQVEGKKILKIARRGKLILIELEKELTILIHLKLTGRIIGFEGKQTKRSSFTRAVFYFKDRGFRFDDLRKFGSLSLLGAVEKEAFLSRFGPEPLDDSFNLESFIFLLSRQGRKKIKPLLMDQSFIAGIGNIYADEILHFASVRPDRPVYTLTPVEVKKVFEGIKKVLTEAVEAKGTSFRDYVDFSGQKGDYLYRLKVYQRTGKPCCSCGKPIKRIRLGGRGTHFCPSCQK